MSKRLRRDNRTKTVLALLPAPPPANWRVEEKVVVETVADCKSAIRLFRRKYRDRRVLVTCTEGPDGNYPFDVL